MQQYLNDAIHPDQLARALVIKFRHLGDVLLTAPVFSALKLHAPHLQIDALVYADTQAMLREHPAINQVIGVDRTAKSRSWRERLRADRELMRKLQANGYDLIINLTENNRAARICRAIKPQVSVSQRYPHRKGRWWQKSFTHTYTIPDQPRHTVEVHLDALRRLGFVIQADHKAMRLGISAEAQTAVNHVLTENQLAQKPFLVVHPASRWMFKSWNAGGFAEVIASLSNQYQIVLTSGPDAQETALVAQILDQLPAELASNLLNLAGRLNLYEFAALLDRAHCFIGVDSVPMHMAAALRTPTVALFGPSNDLIWGPWQTPHRLIKTDVPCRPCGLDGCGNSKISDCLQVIPASRVIAAVNDLLSTS